MDLPPRLAVIHQPVRLRLMGLLWKHRDVSYTQARDSLAVTDGNLASHVARLESAGFVAPRRVLLRDGFSLRYRITPDGAAAFKEYLDTLRRFLEAAQDLGNAAPSPSETAAFRHDPSPRDDAAPPTPAGQPAPGAGGAE